MPTTFGDKLKAIRKDKHWSLDKMAEFLGTNKQTLSRYERGERTPKISDVDAFATKLGIPLEEFSERKGTMRIGLTDAMPFHPSLLADLEARLKPETPQEDAKLTVLWRSATLQAKRAAIAVLESMKEENLK